MKFSIESLLYVFIALAVVFSIVSLSLILGRMEKVDLAAKAAEQENVPAKLQVIKLSDSSCPKCFNTDSVVQGLKRANVNVASERAIEFSSDEARQLIERYQIEKLPTVIVLGDVNSSSVVNLWNQNWQVEMENGTQVSAVYLPALPYRDLAEGRVKGLVNITRLLDTSCAQCSSVEPIINSFRQAGAVIAGDVNIEYNSPRGAELISRFGVREIPAVIISRDILDYQSIAEIWPRLNATEKNDSYALHVLQPPYRDLAENRVVGLVDVIYVNDSSCTNCYNVLVHEQILGASFGLFLANGTVADVNSADGQALVKKYNITLVPTFVMSPDARYYSGLMQVWPSVGTEENTWYVFRNVSVIGGIYKNLETGKVIVPAG